MDQSYSFEVDATPDFVLAVLRDQHRHAVEIDAECDPEVDLTFASTVADWRIANDLLPAKRLGHALNQSWGLSLSDTQWRSVLVPPSQKTLKDVTALIAAHTKRTQLKPFRIAGTACLPAAAFLAIKDCLAADGADVSDVAPSTPLHEYTRRDWLSFVCRVSRLAPGALPPISINSPAHEANLAVSWVGALLLLVGILATTITSQAFPVPLIGAFVLIATTVASYLIKDRPAANVTFGNLTTFRDLATCIASNSG